MNPRARTPLTVTAWRKVRADVLGNRLRSGLAMVSLAVGTTAVGAMVLAGTTVDASFATGFAAANPPSAVVGTSPFAGDLVADVAAHPTVAAAEGRRLHRLRGAGPDGTPVGLELVAMPDFADNHVALVEPVDGAWPPPAGTVVLERASAVELGVDIGDAVRLELPGRPARELRVSGTALDAWEVAPMLGGLVRGYVDMGTMADVAGSGDLNALYLRAAGDPASRPRALEMTAAVRDDVLGPAGVAVASTIVDEPGVHRADNALSFLVVAMQVLSVLALVIAVALVANTVAALLAQQRRQVGVMKAVGATTRQLTAQYLAYVAVLSLGSLALSVPASLLLGRAVAGFVADLANVDLVAMGLPVAPIVLQVAIATVLPLGAVVVSVRRAARRTVRASLSDHGLTAGTASPRVRLPMSRVTTMAARAVGRNRVRLGLTVLTVALSGAVLVGVTSTGAGLGRLGDQVAGYHGHDVGLELGEPVPARAAIEAIGDDAAVDAVEGWVRGQGRRARPDGTAGDAIDLLGVPPASTSIDPTLLQGRWIEPGDDHAIVVNTHVLDAEPDVEIGDTLVLDVRGDRHPWTVVGIASTTLVGPVAYTSASDLAAATGAPGATNLLAVQVAAGADPAAAAERLAAAGRDAGLPVVQVQTHDEVRAATDGLFDIAVALLLVVGIVLAVVAVIGVTGTVTLGVVEQTREIGVLRTLGATTWAVRRLLLVQGLAIAGIGGLVGVALSVPVVLALGGAIEDTLISAEFPTTFSWGGVAVWLVVALAIGALGATQPARIASRLTVRDTLAYE